MKTIAVANSKGGCGKTTTVFNLGAELARQGKKVLLWDMDPQQSLTRAFKLNFDQDQVYCEDILATSKVNPALAPIEVSDNLYLIPATVTLGNLEAMLSNGEGSTLLKKAISRLSQFGFDFVLLDPPGAMDPFMQASLVAADEVLIPVKPTDFDFDSMGEFKSVLDSVIEHLNPNLKVRGLLFNQIISQSKSHARYLDILKQANWDKLILNSSIKMATVVANSPSHGQDVGMFEPSSKSANEYKQLAQEILTWNN